MQIVTLKFEEDKREFELPIPECDRFCDARTNYEIESALGSDNVTGWAPAFGEVALRICQEDIEDIIENLEHAIMMARDARLWWMDEFNKLCDVTKETEAYEAAGAWKAFEKFLEEKIDADSNAEV